MFVKLWMSSNLITVNKGQTISETVSCMTEHSIRRLPVVGDKGELVGIVSKQDIFNAMPSIIDGGEASSSTFMADNVKVETIMTPQPLSVDPLTPLEKVAQSMRKHKIGGVPVLEKGVLVGIITESDIFAAFTEVLGANIEGVRIEMIVGKKAREFYAIIDIFKRYGISVQSITAHRDFGENQQLLTVKVSGDECDEMLDALRESGAQINRITNDENDDA